MLTVSWPAEAAQRGMTFTKINGRRAAQKTAAAPAASFSRISAALRHLGVRR